MTELVVLSGKGGTGKTSLVGCLAALARDLVLVDCDVDAANLHLIVDHNTLEEHDFSGSHRATIVPDKCTGCGICFDKCRFGAIQKTADNRSVTGERFWIKPLACEGCGLCVHLCPENAIEFDSVISGQWFLSESCRGPFLHARLGIAQANSGKLVSLLREQARRIAEASGRSTIIIDGPPGIGCPVIASLSNASYVLIVTEPSISAFHDMERLAQLAQHFEIPAGICVNKFDLSSQLTESIVQYADQQHIPVHGSIPFDPTFTDAQVRGKPYLRLASDEQTRIIRRLWYNVCADMQKTTDASERKFVV